MRKLSVIYLAIIVLVIPGILLSVGCRAPVTPVENSAAIVDQLEPYEPNPVLISDLTSTLAGSGLKVDYFHGDEVNVDFYRNLSSRGYKIIIFRTHAGLLGSEGKAIARTCFFTNEPYSDRKYVTEQLTDQLAKARTDPGNPWVFAIGANFVNRSMQGQFNKTAILMMGCSTLYLSDLAEALVKKGASTCVGWDASIGADYMDKSMLDLVGKLYRDRQTVDGAVAQTLKDAGSDPDFGGTLKYYPLGSGNLIFK